MTSDKRSRTTEVNLGLLQRILKFESLSVADRAAVDQLIAEASEEPLRYPALDTPLQLREYGTRIASLLRRTSALTAKYAPAGDN